MGGAGQCEGSSSETWDSGISVGCSSDPAKNAGEPTDVPKEYCPVAVEPSPPYPRICVKRPGETDGYPALTDLPMLPLDLCDVRETRTGAAVCADAHFNRTRLVDLNAHILATFHAQEGVSAGHIFVKRGLAAGLVCLGYDCVQVAVGVELVPGGNVTRFVI